MLGTRYLFTSLLALNLAVGVSAGAAPITQAEHIVCSDLEHCVDILNRHDASEFDYGVLEQEFRRFGPRGRRALFGVLRGENGNPDVARILNAHGQLAPAEEAIADNIWNGPSAINAAPLFSAPTLRNRDRWISGLGHADPLVQEFAQQIYRMDNSLKSAPLTRAQQTAVLKDILRDPSAMKADLLGHIPARGHESQLEHLIATASNPELASSAYASLYRADPARAFETFMRLARAVKSGEQAGRLGALIASRHENRADGFYGRFASDVSGDIEMPVNVRAVGLHAWFLIMDAPRTSAPSPVLAIEFDAPRLEALSFLLTRPASMARDYGGVLSQLPDTVAFPALSVLLKKHLEYGQFTDMSLLKASYGTGLEPRAVQAALASNDLSILMAAISFAEGKAPYKGALQKLTTHPVTKIRVAAELASQRKLTKTKPSSFARAVSKANDKSRTCRISSFNRSDIMAQMPFFDDQPLKMDNKDPWLRTVSRKTMVAAHPTRKGWLAAYSSSPKSELIFFDNRTGAGKIVGDFASPFAIIPDRPLPLGQTTRRVWVVDGPGPSEPRSFLYRLTLSDSGFQQTRVAELPSPASNVTLTITGDIVLDFRAVNGQPSQSPLRYRPNGEVFSACRQAQGPASALSPN